jgi:hypothetical protein
MPATSVRAAAVSASMRCNWLLAVAAARPLSSSLDRHSRSEKPGFLRFATELGLDRTRVAQRHVLLPVQVERALEALAHGRPGARLQFAFVVGALDARLLDFLLALQFRQVAVDLRAALFEARLGLGQLQRLDLGGVQGLLRLLQGTRAPRQLALLLGQVLFGALLARARGILGFGTRVASCAASSSISRWRSMTPWVLASGT